MSTNPDMLYTFTGISSAQIINLLNLALTKRQDLEVELVEWLSRRPFESLTGFLLGTSAAFYLAEREANPKIQTFVDALYYISTCLSVGYADIFAQTQTGKLIATLVMTIGPAMTGNLLDPRERTEPATAAMQALILERLDAILAEQRRIDI